MKKSIKPGTNMAPVPVVMVSCGDENRSNITTIAWTGVLNSEPPLVYVSIRPSRYSYDIIKQTGEFVINIPNGELVWETDFCGTKSGKEMDKFKTAQLTKIESEKVKAPSIGECPIHLECKVVEVKELGSHDLFIGEVIAVRAEEEYVNENGVIDYAKANLLTYAGKDYLCQNKIVAQRGIGIKEKKE